MASSPEVTTARARVALEVCLKALDQAGFDVNRSRWSRTKKGASLIFEVVG